MKLYDMYPSKYARGVDLQGQSVTVTIEKIQLEKMRPNPKSPEIKKYVLYTVEGKERDSIVEGLSLPNRSCYRERRDRRLEGEEDNAVSRTDDCCWCEACGDQGEDRKQ